MNLFRWLIQPDPRGSYYSAWDLLDQRHDDCAECLRLDEFYKERGKP